jgi:transcriptional regulator with XRE-family HTH domain
MTTEEHYGTKELERDYGPITFGDALESFRMCEEMSQRAFAEMLGISAQSLCDLEKGRRIPSARRAAKIANKLGEPESVWIRLAFQDMLRHDELDYTVSVS